MVEPKSVKENACQNGQCSEGRALPTLRTLVLFFWCPFSELRDEIPTAFKQGNAGIKANDRGVLSESAHLHSVHTTLSHTHASPAGGAQETSERSCCLHSYSSNAIWFSSLMASASRRVDRWPHRFRLGS